MEDLIDNIFLVVIAALFVIFLIYRPEYECTLGTNYSKNLTTEAEHYGNVDDMNTPNLSSSKTFNMETNQEVTQDDVNMTFGKDYGNIGLLVDRAVAQIADYTIRGVVTPCMTSQQVMTVDERIECVQSYKHYWTDILKYPIIDMFGDMERLEINPFTMGQNKLADQQYEATVGLTQAFAKSLDRTLDLTRTKYSTLGYVPEEFKKNFQFVLKQWFMYRLYQIFRNPDHKWSGSELGETTASVVSETDADTLSTGLPEDADDTTMITNGIYSATCSDIESGKVKVYVDGTAIRCA